jgi:hypothetical protein
VDVVWEVPDLLQERELILERQDPGDLAALEVPDRRVADLDGLAGRRHAAIRAGMRAAPDEGHGQLSPSGPLDTTAKRLAGWLIGASSGSAERGLEGLGRHLPSEEVGVHDSKQAAILCQWDKAKISFEDESL